jgi:hypothetical protein
MALPVRPITFPAVLNGQSNGKLPASVLTTIVMPGGGVALVLTQCAPKWQALLAAAAEAGYRLCQDGDYRTYDEQVALLKARYRVVTSGAYDISWDGKHWRHVSGATVARPGDSNHGWGLALDLCMPGGKSVTTAAVNWLCAHAEDFGISAELQSEPWHWRPYDGDRETTAVLAYEQAHPEGDDMAFGDTLNYGDKNDDVGAAQVLLRDGLGVDLGSAGVDHQFGDRTAAGFAAVVGGDGHTLTATGWAKLLVAVARKQGGGSAVDVDAIAKAAAALVKPALVPHTHDEGATGPAIAS